MTWYRCHKGIIAYSIDYSSLQLVTSSGNFSYSISDSNVKSFLRFEKVV